MAGAADIFEVEPQGAGGGGAVVAGASNLPSPPNMLHNVADVCLPTVAIP
jgi:hypothetical protein